MVLVLLMYNIKGHQQYYDTKQHPPMLDHHAFPVAPSFVDLSAWDHVKIPKK